MSVETNTIEKAGEKLTSNLEKIVDGKFLILLLSLCFYVDIWLLRFEIDPTSISLSTSLEGLKNVPIFTIAIFILSYSLLMVGFFPAFRKIIGAIRMLIQSSVYLEKNTKEAQRLSDWSLAFVVFSIYDAIIGYFFSPTSYKGIAIYVISLLQFDGFDIVIFRISIIFLWLVCVALAMRVDDPITSN